MLALVLGAVLGVGAGPVSAQSASSGWAFTSQPFSELWFHGMALVDPVGPGPSPLYDPGYPGEVAQAKAAARVRRTRLDSQLGRFRSEFRRDPAFEVLHFLPLYFPQAGRMEIFTALELLAGTDEGIPQAPSPRTSFGMAAVGSVLTTPGQRRVLGEFVLALLDEWADFYEVHWQETAGNRQETEVSLRSEWRNNYGPALAPFLNGLGMPGGMVVLVPSIGGEGRIFGGSPQNPGDNILMVSAPAGSSRANEAIFSMLRELSFPLVRRVMEQIGITAGNPNEEESLAAKAAIRSGALVLEMSRPEILEEYQRFFLSQLSSSHSSGGDEKTAFAGAFGLKTEFDEALREEISKTIFSGGIG